MTTPAAEANKILTAALGFLKQIRDSELDGTERRQIQNTGYDMRDILGHNKIGWTLIEVSHYGAAAYILEADAMIAEVEAALAA